ncbi:NAD(+)/NADH kinase [Desulforamulus aquiferis]|uniref:NAD kinase n=1 Tax=Desulforamulus aquiferis TaxID=1397668 RepID=A0AAW7ZB75_9FIRM|nr:NAD(+)/NADH kinase [Desulforamulus aquiferis]MDO7786404.1 NAD(+)/NADH kinase [Desulforamulus aquiferis]
MNTIGLVVNSSKGNLLDPVRQVISWLKERNISVLFNEESALMLGQKGQGIPTRELGLRCDCIMVWGGDGTLLNSARQVAHSGTPIFGVNLGRLGFLTEIDIPDLKEKLNALVAGDFTIEERMMLEASVIRDGQVISTSICLNDAVVSKGTSIRMVYLEIYISGEFVGKMSADGIIVASPTGSTAYSLSAGGPIVAPETKVLLVTPICPHSLSNRPIVTSPDNVVEIQVLRGDRHTMLTLDGQSGFSLNDKDMVIIKKSELSARFLKIQKTGFYKVLREKLKEWQRDLD